MKANLDALNAMVRCFGCYVICFIVCFNASSVRRVCHVLHCVWLHRSAASRWWRQSKPGPTQRHGARVLTRLVMFWGFQVLSWCW